RTPAQVGFPGDVAHGLALAFLPTSNRVAQSGWKAVVPGRFHQDCAGVSVAGLCDIAPMMPLAGGVLRRYQAEITHELLGVRESTEVPDLGDEDDGGEKIHPTQTGQCRYERLHAPVLALGAQRLGEPLDASACIENGLAISGKGNGL